MRTRIRLEHLASLLISLPRRLEVASKRANEHSFTITLTQFRNSVEHMVQRPTLALVESVGVDIKVDITQCLCMLACHTPVLAF